MPDGREQLVLGANYAGIQLAATNATSTRSCLPTWDSGHAKLTSCAIPYVSAIPLLLATLILFLGAVGKLLSSKRPAWTRVFITEYPPISLDLGSHQDAKGTNRVLALGLFAVNIIGIVAYIVQVVSVPDDVSASLLLAAWCVTALMVALSRPRTAPTHLLILYIMEFFVESLRLLSIDLRRDWAGLPHYVAFASPLAAIIFILNMPVRDPSMPTLDISPVGDPPNSEYRSPEDNLRLWQFLSISWMLPMIRVGKTRTLNEDDVWTLAYEFQHTRLYEKFSRLTGTVIARLLKANGLDIAFLTISASTETVCEYLVPVVLQQLLISMENPLSPKRVALTYAFIILILRIIVAQSEVFNTWFGRRAYERSRGEMILMVYEKALSRKNVIGVDPELTMYKDGANGHVDRVDHAEDNSLTPRPGWLAWLRADHLFRSSRSKKKPKKITATEAPASIGKILNLIRGDVYDVAQRFWEIEQMIESVLGLVLSLIVIWKLLGPSCFIGILTVLVGQALNAIFTKIQLKIIARGRGATDRRLQVTTQFIEAIRHLRWYGWHGHWIKQLHESREQELRLRVLNQIWSSIISFTNSLTSGLFPVVALYGYTVLGGHTLSIDIIFPALTLFGRMASTLQDIPQIITQLANAYVAMCRIEAFMHEENREEDTSRLGQHGPTIHITNCDFSWPGQDHCVLKNVNLEFDVGLHVVYGKVGAGKTALLQGLLGELDKKAGEAHIPNEMIAYCAQTPWLQSMTIRDNILFSAPYDEWRYRNVLDACELLPDLAEFEHGDLSAIGENGIGLSGGQKARVALARAMYSRARILLLDDPISALDFTTAQNIVSKCFDGSLVADRVVILVTHRTNLVSTIATQRIQIEAGQAVVSSDDSGPIADANVGGPAPALTNKDDTGVRKLEESTKANKFEDQEYRADFGVQARIYWNYIRAGKLRNWAIMTLLLAMWRLSGVFQAWYMKEWGEAYQKTSQIYLFDALSDLYPIVSSASSFGHSKVRGNAFGGLNAMFSHSNMTNGHINSLSNQGLFDNWPRPEENVKPWLIFYLITTTWISLTSWLAQIFLIVLFYVSAKKLFSEAIVRVSEANFRFYDVTPVGRLMNRLTSDIGTIDANIAAQFHFISYHTINWVASLIVIGSVTPAFLAFSLCFVAFTVWMFNLFLPTSQSLRRLETVSLSPLFANFGELLHGLTTVRAFHAQQRFLQRIVGVVDKFQAMDHFYWTLQNWLAFRLQNASAIATFILTVIALYTNVSAGLTAFVLTAAGNFVRSTHTLCRRFGALQMDFVSVERIDELLQLPEEPSGDVDPPASWPAYGSDIILKNVTVRYAPHLEPALNDVSIRIPGGTTTVILGRTGSGKSTLVVTLLNVVRPESGSVTMDKLDLRDVKNQALRERVTFVAQDPVLFPGTIRHNLDPTGQHTDEECDAVLQRVCGRHGWTLATHVEAGGRNFSQGQRQLLGLTRAVLRRSSVVILDEATASIDYESATEIMAILREELREATVVTIAHRLEAVKGAEYAIVLDNGRVVRQGPAAEIAADDGNGVEAA